jgi:hypothetical protein
VSGFGTEGRSLFEVVAVDTFFLEVGAVRSVLGLGTDFLCERRRSSGVERKRPEDTQEMRLTSILEENVRKGNSETGDEGKKETSVLIAHSVEHVVGEKRSRSTEHVTED